MSNKIVFDKIHAARLTKLADALENMEPNQYGLRRWNYEAFLIPFHGEQGRTGPNLCGSAGCALGACVTLFPEAWTVESLPIQFGNYLPHLKGDSCTGQPYTEVPYKAAQKFFGLRPTEALHLFCPVEQRPGKYGGEKLYGDATPQQVAANIRAFLEFKRKQQAEP